MSEGQRIRDFMTTATREQASIATRAISLRVLSGVVMRTPVDTGRARGNWQVAIGTGSVSGETNQEDKSGSSTISTGSSTIERQRDLEQVQLVNNVPYIGPLDDGSSRQAPQGMVSETLAGLGLGTGRDG